MNPNPNPNQNPDSLYRDIVLLYCPEKVGSSSIVSSIRTCASDKFVVFHTHDHTVAKINSKKAHIDVTDIKLNSTFVNPITGTERRVFIIDIFREPIERKISYYFQKLSELHFNNSEHNLLNYPIEKVIKRFNDIYIHMESTDYFNERYGLVDDDIIKSFDFEKKYVVKKDVFGTTYVKLRLADSNNWGNILSAILGTPITMVKNYDTMDKNIGLLYTRFKEQYRLPYNYFELLLTDKTLDLYMDKHEKEAYLNKWFGKTTKRYEPYTLEKYKIYVEISSENKYYDSNADNVHYSDDGCVCAICTEIRKKVCTGCMEGKILHKYDEFYNCNICLKLGLESGSYDIIVNVVNS